MKTRWLIAGVAFALGVVILGSLFADALALQPPDAVVTGIGLVLLCLTLWPLFRRIASDIDTAPVLTPELPRRVPVPGTDFDRHLADRIVTWTRSNADSASYTQQRVRDRLRAVTRTILVAYEGLTPAEADTQIESGAWTRNHVAETFLQGKTFVESWWGRLRFDRLRGRSSSFLEGVEQTVAALLKYTGAPDQAQVSSVESRWSALVDTVAPSIASKQSSRTDRENDSSATHLPRIRLTHHWQGIGAFALASLAFGILFEEAGFVLLSTIGVGYMAYARVYGVPDATVAVTRSLSQSDPAPDEVVRVTVTVRNEGEDVLSDLRVIDGVPEHLGVEDGSPRCATVLPPGQTDSFEYAIRTRRGVHPFTPARVRVRPLADAIEVETTVESETTLTCRPAVTSTLSVPLRDALTQYVGQNPTDIGGDGIEFHSTREYRRGDPVSRIDWKRFARSRELATVAYREDRAAEIVLVLDTRRAAYVSMDPFEPHACDRSVGAAAELFTAFQQTGNRVGLAAFGPDPCWVTPTASRESRARVRALLTEHEAFSQDPPEGTCYISDWIDEFRQRIATPAQLVFFSPLCDDAAVRAARNLEAYGYRATVISPDPTGGQTIGQRVAFLERRARVYELREAAVRVVDWPLGDPLAVALARAVTQWSQ